MANAPELEHVGIIENNAGNRVLSIACNSDTSSSNIEILIHSFVDLGPYVDPNTGRQGHLFRLNGSELKILRWGNGDGEFNDQYPEISYQKGDLKIIHLFDTEEEGVDLSYAGLVAHFQENLVAEEMVGGRRRHTRHALRKRSHRRKTAGRRK